MILVILDVLNLPKNVQSEGCLILTLSLKHPPKTVKLRQPTRKGTQEQRQLKTI